MNIDRSVKTLIQLALEEDLGEIGDVTSKSTLPENQLISAKIVSKQAGVIAGLALIEAVFHQLDTSIVIHTSVNDGDTVKPGQMISRIEGDSYAILAGERTVINFLQRLSGVATLTQQFVQKVAGTNAIILDTRKTTPGWRMLEKYAVKVGGGQNHRIGLFDMVLIKDNHIDAAGSITKAVQQVRQTHDADNLPIEVEVKNLDELYETLELGVDRILLDNMTIDELSNCVKITAGRVPLEASGNVSLDTVRNIAETDVNYISVGALTHSAKAFDLSMRLLDSK